MQARRGCQSPTWEQVLPHYTTDGPQAAMLAEEFFGEPMQWQRRQIFEILSRDIFDKYIYHTYGIEVPRQNGKSWLIRARCFYGAVIDGEKILYTCQHGDTADEMFKALSAPFEDEDNAELHDLLLAVRKTNGQQAIYLKNGGCIRFSTRTATLARGRSYDVIIYDEAQELTKAQHAASLFAMSASAKHNTQVIYIGTPPQPECAGDVFARARSDVRAGLKPDVGWAEWSVDEVGDVTCVDRWYLTNPGAGTIIDEVAIKTECDSTDAFTFAVERLGYWADTKAAAVEHVLTKHEWSLCEVGVPPDGGLVAYGVKFSPDGARVALSVAVKADDGEIYIEGLACEPGASGTGWLVDWLVPRGAGCAGLAIDGRGSTEALVQRLADEGFPTAALMTPSATDVATAAAIVQDGVRAQTVTHHLQPAMDESATKSIKRKIGAGGGFGFGDGAAPSALIESASLAVWAAATTKRRPGRKMRLL